MRVIRELWFTLRWVVRMLYRAAMRRCGRATIEEDVYMLFPERMMEHEETYEEMYG
jgi:hypothetical protein